MNYSTAVMLFNENIRAVRTIYEAEDTHPGQTAYIFKTLDSTVKVGDLVIVPTNTRHKMTVNKVVAVDVEVDFESEMVLKWIIDKVQPEQYESILAEETKWIETIKASEKHRKREDIKKNVMEMCKGADLDKLAIANMTAAE